MKSKPSDHTRVRVALRAPLALLLALAPGAYLAASTVLAASTYDDFDDGVINPLLWAQGLEGGSSLDETGGELVASLPATAGDPAGNTWGAQVASRCELRGDFDIQVDFRLATWPAGNGVRVALAVTGTNEGNPAVALAERASLSVSEEPGFLPREVYAFDDGIRPPTNPLVGGSDLSGKLRLEREGTRTTGFAWMSGTWSQIGSSIASPTSDVRFHANVFTSDSQFADAAVVAAFDNVVITTGDLVNCPYDFSGFFSPVDNLPAVNTVNAGRAIPIKFSLGSDEGLDIFAAGYPKSVKVDCDSSASLDEIELTMTAGGSSLQYEASTDVYTYVWKTEKSWAGTCRQLIVKLDDGTSHIASFRFR